MISLTETLAKIDENIAKAAKEVAERRDTWNNRADNTMLFLLESGGFGADNIYGLWGMIDPYIRITKKDVRLIHAIVGPLQRGMMEPLGDGRSRKVKVHLNPKDKRFSHINFTYETTLPRGSKCKVKTVVQKDKRIVCEA